VRLEKRAEKEEREKLAKVVLPRRTAAKRDGKSHDGIADDTYMAIKSGHPGRRRR
jgi:hypothetical protein